MTYNNHGSFKIRYRTFRSIKYESSQRDTYPTSTRHMASRDSTHGRFTIWHIPNDNEAAHFSSTKTEDTARAKAKIENHTFHIIYLKRRR